MFLESKTQVEKRHLLAKRGLQQNVFFMSLCFAKSENACFGGQILYISTFLNAKNTNDHFSKLVTGPSQVINWAKLGVRKKRPTWPS